MLNYYYHKTKRIEDLLLEVKATGIAFETLKTLPHLEENIRRQSLLKSSLFSARIEGNPLTLTKVKYLDSLPSNFHKLEVINLLKTYKYINFGKAPRRLSEKFIFKLHKMVLEKISPESGFYRQERWAIFNQTGIVVYLAPSHKDVPRLMKEMIRFINNCQEPVVIKAALAQFIFEKIHPFADGNGRVGRLISAYLLRQGNFHFRNLVSLEEFIDENRSEYYRALEAEKNATEFVEFFLEGFLFQAKKTLERLQEVKTEAPEDSLLPRRREILEIIRDHPECSFDFLARRFQNINPKTLHYDLKQLQNKGFVLKIGGTRGSLYRAL